MCLVLQVGHRNVASLAGTDEAAQGGQRAVESHISHVAFSGDGTVMATVDVHPSAAASGAVGSALKFWDRRETGAAAGGAPLYTLNSHISEPQRCACMDHPDAPSYFGLSLSTFK